MGGTVVMIVVLLLFPVMVIMSMALVAAGLGTLLKVNRDRAFVDTEYLELSEANPYRR